MHNTISLAKNFEFRTVYSKGRSFANRHLIMYIMENNQNAINRVGFSVSKKVGNSVIRNRVKRVLRETYRASEPRIKIGFDIVIIARTGIENVKFEVVLGSLCHLLKLHKLLV